MREFVRTSFSVRQLLPGNVTGRLHGPIVGPTGQSDRSYVRLSVRPVGQTGWTDCSRTAHMMQLTGHIDLNQINVAC